jgi:hypothetical protein
VIEGSPETEKRRAKCTTLYISTSALSGDGMAFSLRYYRDCAICPTRDMPIKASDSCASPTFTIDPKTVCRSSKQVSGGTSKFDFRILVSSPTRYGDLADFRQEHHSAGDGRYQNAARCSLSISFRHCGGSWPVVAGGSMAASGLR